MEFARYKLSSPLFYESCHVMVLPAYTLTSTFSRTEPFQITADPQKWQNSPIYSTCYIFPLYSVVCCLGVLTMQSTHRQL